MVEKVKGVVFELLEDATRRGDKVALVAFKGGVPGGDGRAAADVAASPWRRRRLEDDPAERADAARGRAATRPAPPARRARAAPELGAARRRRQRRAADRAAARGRRSRSRTRSRRRRALRRARIGCVVAEVAAPREDAPSARRGSRRHAAAAGAPRRRPARRRRRGGARERGRRRGARRSPDRAGLGSGARGRSRALGRARDRGRPTRTSSMLRRGRTIEWATQTVTQGEVLDAFAAYCRDELDDVEVLDATPSRLALGWRRERSTVELRAGFLFCERLAEDGPALLLGPIGPKAVGALPRRRDPARAAVALLDLAAAGEDRRRPLERLRLPRVVPARRVRREDPARARVHERPRRARDHLARHGLRPPAAAAHAIPPPWVGDDPFPLPARLAGSRRVCANTRADSRRAGAGARTAGSAPPWPRRRRSTDEQRRAQGDRDRAGGEAGEPGVGDDLAVAGDRLRDDERGEHGRREQGDRAGQPRGQLAPRRAAPGRSP